MLRLAVVVGATTMAACAWATPTPKFIGTWVVSSQKDAMSDEDQQVAFVPDDDKNWLFAVRCLNKEPSIYVMASPRGEDDFKRSELYNVKFRPDKGEITELKGLALQDKGVEIVLNQDVYRKIVAASTFALRFTTASSDGKTDMTFTNRSAKAALDGVGTACSLK